MLTKLLLLLVAAGFLLLVSCDPQSPSKVVIDEPPGGGGGGGTSAYSLIIGSNFVAQGGDSLSTTVVLSSTTGKLSSVRATITPSPGLELLSITANEGGTLNTTFGAGGMTFFYSGLDRLSGSNRILDLRWTAPTGAYRLVPSAVSFGGSQPSSTIDIQGGVVIVGRN